jgi:hypothetical protein
LPLAGFRQQLKVTAKERPKHVPIPNPKQLSHFKKNDICRLIVSRNTALKFDRT